MALFIIFSFLISAHPASILPSLQKLPESVHQAIKDSSNRFQLDPKLIYSIAKAESNFNPGAISRKGALGLMQIMRSTGDALGMPHSFELHSQLNAACEYLRQLFNQFHSNIRWVVAAYNAGPAAVEKYRGIPPYPETQEYVSRVMGYYEELKASN